MRRHGDLWPMITDMENIRTAFHRAALHKNAHRGVDFLGYRHFNGYKLLRKSTTKRVRKRLAALPLLYKKEKMTFEQFRSSVASTYGWLKHANSHNLRVKIQLKELMNFVGEQQCINLANSRTPP